MVTSNPHNPPMVEREKLAYFKPSEMVFVIRHPTDDMPTEKEIDALLGDENGGGVIGWSYKNKENDDLKISRVKDRELHFPGTTQLPKPPSYTVKTPSGGTYISPEPAQQTAFSLIPVDVRVPADENNNPEGLVETDELAKLITNLDGIRGSLEETLNSERDKSQKVTVEVISPNWLSVPTMSEYGGGGGPGSRPVPHNGNFNKADLEFHLPLEVKQLCPVDDKRGEGVKVAIFDTAPCLHDLVEAYEIYQKVRPERHQKQRQEVGEHNLIKTLLKPGGPLHLHPATIEELYRMRAVHLRDHDYIMTDHGLFVAGIIHSIAPAAEIHLYEVLNPQGAGDLESIARGLWKVADEQYQAFIKTGKETYPPLVVNCSLMLYLPRDGNPDSPDEAKVIGPPSPHSVIGHRLTDLDQAIVDQIRNDLNKTDQEKFVVRSGSVIMWICDLLYYLGARVIAAAGNDWDPSDEGRPETRYPAAFERALGIGALPKDVLETNNGKRKPSSFSNISDEPGRDGVATLGGEPGQKKGVLGIYLGKFPPEQSAAPNTPGLDNENHLAWWAGTSFATPIASGAIAAVLSGPSKPETTEKAIALMYEKGGIVDNQTDYKEDLLDITQGEPKPPGGNQP